MSRSYKPHIPESVGEVVDQLGLMMLYSPTFQGEEGLFAGRNVDTEFAALNEGLARLRKTLGEQRYAKMVEMSAKMRAHFEADPDDKTDDTIKGRELIAEMQGMLRKRSSDSAA